MKKFAIFTILMSSQAFAHKVPIRDPELIKLTNGDLSAASQLRTFCSAALIPQQHCANYFEKRNSQFQIAAARKCVEFFTVRAPKNNEAGLKAHKTDTVWHEDVVDGHAHGWTNEARQRAVDSYYNTLLKQNTESRINEIGQAKKENNAAVDLSIEKDAGKKAGVPGRNLDTTDLSVGPSDRKDKTLIEECMDLVEADLVKKDAWKRKDPSTLTVEERKGLAEEYLKEGRCDLEYFGIDFCQKWEQEQKKIKDRNAELEAEQKKKDAWLNFINNRICDPVILGKEMCQGAEQEADTTKVNPAEADPKNPLDKPDIGGSQLIGPKTPVPSGPSRPGLPKP